MQLTTHNEQINGEYKSKDDQMAEYTTKDDRMAIAASAVNFKFRRKISIEYISRPSINKSDEEMLRLHTSLGWMDPIVAYLKMGHSPTTRLSLRGCNISLADLYYWETSSYSKLHSDQYLRHLILEEARRVMQWIYVGDCGNHAGR